jgi:hypothetical protein
LTGNCNSAATSVHTFISAISIVDFSDVPGGSPSPSCSPSGVLSGAGGGTVPFLPGLNKTELLMSEYIEFDFQHGASNLQSISLPAGVGACGGTTDCVFPSELPTTAPEPRCLLLLGTGVLALLGAAKYRRLVT